VTRYSSPAAVAAVAAAAAREDYHRHSVVHVNPDGTSWQVCRNPYSTPGRRNDWQRGYDDAPPHSWETTRDYDMAFQVGRAYRIYEEWCNEQGRSVPGWAVQCACTRPLPYCVD
jgi:hypothetical protein